MMNTISKDLLDQVTGGKTTSWGDHVYNGTGGMSPLPVHPENRPQRRKKACEGR